MKIFVPYTELQPATYIALIGYDYELIKLKGLYGYAKYFRDRWNDGQGFINIEHDCVPWPGAIEAIRDCPEPWCSYDYSLPCHRNRDMHHETTFVPLGCAKINADMITRTKTAWDKLKKWDILDGYITRLAQTAGFNVHQHFPGIVNANKALLNMKG
jgi:hypothetical protein